MFIRAKKIGLLICLLLGMLLYSASAYASKILVIDLKGSIGPASADYVTRQIHQAKGVDLIVLAIDTPGGLDSSTHLIVDAILNSPIPVVGFVSPTGARAASAGTVILYACTLAAMAPGTHLGAASPVDLLGGDQKSAKPSTMETKVKNDALAYIRSLAQLRDRNVDFAEKAINNAATLTAPEALKAGVINLIAQDLPDLLNKINGQTVEQQGKKLILSTERAEIIKAQADWRMRFLQVITDPTVAYILLLLGIYGIFFEFLNPGYIAPGVIGSIALLVALYALQLLPINYAGLALIFLGIAFIIAEAYAPSFGVLGIGGTLSFILGSVMLMDTQLPSYRIAWSAILAMVFVNLAFFLSIISMAIAARRAKPLHGMLTMVGMVGKALGEVNLEGQAIIKGEIWEVWSEKPIASQTSVKVVAVAGLRLQVEAVVE